MQIEEIGLEAARSQRWDVIVAGSSFSAMFFAHGLRGAPRILFIEKGRRYDHDAWLAGGLGTGETFGGTDTSGQRKRWVANTLFGGNSNCWWAQVPRFHPSDFALASRHGVGTDWPFGYDTLEPFYVEVEEVMEVAGGGGEQLLPRSRPFPYPPHAPSRTSARLEAERPDIWVPVPTARSNGGSRAICCANGVCSVCPIDAKFTIVNGLQRFAERPAALLLQTEVRAIRAEAGTARGVLVRQADGTEAEIAADLVALGTNAIFNPAILLRSGHENAALGRYLHEQHSLSLTIDVVQDNYFGGTSISGHGYGFYDGPHRGEAAAVIIENFNSPTELRSDPGRWTQRMLLKLVAEDLPQAENRVVLAASGEPEILWAGHHAYARRGLDRARDRLQEVMPFEIERIVGERLGLGEAHIQGTHRMGTDPATSVVDPELKVHGLSNVLALGAGSFPSCSPANPTLTLSALALRAGRAV